MDSPQIDKDVTARRTVIYLLHFDRPLEKSGNSQAQHYLGSTVNLEGRLWYHRKGLGAKILKAANDANINYSIAADWPGQRQLEMCMKQTKRLKLFCPVCMGKKAKDPKNYPFASKLPWSWLPENHPVLLFSSETPLESTNVHQVYNHTTQEENVPLTANEHIARLFKEASDCVEESKVDFGKLILSGTGDKIGEQDWIADKDRFWTDI